MAKPRRPKTANVVISSVDDRRYRAESALSTLSRAEEIRKDKGLMRDVAQLAKKQAAALGAIAGANKKGK